MKEMSWGQGYVLLQTQCVIEWKMPRQSTLIKRRPVSEFQGPRVHQSPFRSQHGSHIIPANKAWKGTGVREAIHQTPQVHTWPSGIKICVLTVSRAWGGSMSNTQNSAEYYLQQSSQKSAESQFPSLWNGGEDNPCGPINPRVAMRIKHNTTLGTVKRQSNKSKALSITIFSPTGLGSCLCIKKTWLYISLCLLHILFVPLPTLLPHNSVRRRAEALEEFQKSLSTKEFT